MSAAIQGTIKFVNPTKQSEKTGKWSQSIKVAIPGQADVLICGPSGAFDTYQPNTQVMVEQDGQYWKLAKDQSGVSVTTPCAPMSSTPATVTNGQGYTPNDYDHDAMKQRAKQLAELYLQIAKQVHEDTTFAMKPGQVIASAAATIFIQLRP